MEHVWVCENEATTFLNFGAISKGNLPRQQIGRNAGKDFHLTGAR